MQFMAKLLRQNMTLLIPARLCELREREKKNRIKTAALEHKGTVTYLLQA